MESKLKIVRDKIKNINFLKENEFFELKEYSDQDDETGAEYNFLFSSRRVPRKLEISFSPEFEAIPDCFFVFVEEGKKSKDIGGFLRHSGVIMKNYFDLNQYKGDFSQKVDGFIRFLEKTYESNWKEILVGDKWPEVPINWGIYK